LLQTNRIPVLKASQTAKPIFGFLKHKQLGLLKMDISTVRRCKSIKRKTVEIYNPALILQSLAIQGERVRATVYPSRPRDKRYVPATPQHKFRRGRD
jgi:hypothetical protein